MPITIQEIIASDTISQLVDKTNFNFDQLLLNGGGPAGPAGSQGPVGPGGGRGPQGTTWYEDTASVAPGNTPIAVPPTATPLPNDYYLQFNGQVWEYTGLTWSITTINLTGPVGPAGQSGGFGDSFGSPGINEITALYNAPNAASLGAGTTADNEGIPSIMIGGAVSTTQSLTAFPLTNAYIIPNDIATDVISSRVSTIIHQKNATTKAIVFHGGNANLAENFEQSTFSNLSSIGIGTDDKFVINGAGAKPSTSPVGNLTNVVGFNVTTEKRGQNYEAGKFVTFSTGRDNIPYAGIPSEDSPFKIDVGNGASTTGNSFEVSVSGTAGNSLLRLGNIAPAVTTNTATGSFGLEASLVQVATSPAGEINLFSGGAINLDTTKNITSNGSGAINLLTNAGNIGLRTVSANDLTTQLGNINITQGGVSAGARGNIIIENKSTLPATLPSTGGNINLKTNTGNVDIITGGTLTATFRGGGNVGIGTDNPYTLLHLKKDTATAGSESIILLDNRQTGTSSYYSGGLWGAGYRDVANPGYLAGIDFLRTSQSGGLSSAGEMIFYTTTVANSLSAIRTSNERMRINSAGNVGIGTNVLTNTGLTIKEQLTIGTITTATTEPTSALVATADGLVKKITAAPIPLGGIIMWSGNISNIPNALGWFLCDGSTQNSVVTPDLRDKFIVGSTADNADTTYPSLRPGATLSNTAANAVVVSHQHTWTGSISPSNHNHGYTGVYGTGWPDESGDRTPAGGGNSYPVKSQTKSVTLGVGGTVGATGVSATNANLPPYYSLAYIIYVGV
jgi:hypothetical protein